ncbi:MAG: hypothetical protein WBQ17_15375 [Rhizomicrobium sp.]
MIGFTIRSLMTGRARMQVWVDERRKSPFFFWFDIVLYGMLIAGFLGLAISQYFPPRISN